MTETTDVDAAPEAVRLRRPTSRPARSGWLAQLGALVLAMVVTGALAQVVHPFIRHDDWAALLGRDEPGSTAHVVRNLYEGRWLNTVYWYVVGQHTSIVAASVVFFGAYAAFVWRFASALAPPSALGRFLLTFALFVSAIWVRLVYWPGTLSASMVVAAIAVWTLSLAHRRGWLLVAWLLCFVVLSVLSYPPVAALVFFAFVVSELHQPARRLVAGAVGFVVAYGIGVLAVYALNWLAFGTFGLKISAWRRPNPLESIDDVMTNFGRYANQLGGLVTLVGWAGAIGVIALVWALVDRTTRRSAVIAAASVLVVISIEAGLTVYSGVVTGTRGSLWAWPALCLPAALLLKGIRASRVAGAVALAVIATVGVLTWRADIGVHQVTRGQYDTLVADTAQTVAQHPGDPVVMWMDPRWRTTAAGNMTAVTVQFMLHDQHGLYPRWCRPAECAAIAEQVARDPRADTLSVNGLTVMRVPRPPAWL